jgi:hypothetical protein
MAGGIKLSLGALTRCLFFGEIFTKSPVNKNDDRKLKLLSIEGVKFLDQRAYTLMDF